MARERRWLMARVMLPEKAWETPSALVTELEMVKVELEQRWQELIAAA